MAERLAPPLHRGRAGAKLAAATPERSEDGGLHHQWYLDHLILTLFDEASP
jgi:hypothetical protein